MKNAFSLVASTVFFLSGCNEVEHRNEESPAPPKEHVDTKQTTRRSPEVKSRIGSREFFEESTNRTPEKITDYVKDRADRLGVTQAEALSVVFDEIVSGQDRGRQLSVFTSFYPVIFLGESRMSELLSTMPAGDLRKLIIQGLSQYELEEILEIYHAMPESADRTRVGTRAVTTAYFRNGFDAAVEILKSMTLRTEADAALLALVGQMDAVYRGFVPPGSSADDVETHFEIVRALAKEGGPELISDVDVKIMNSKAYYENRKAGE